MDASISLKCSSFLQCQHPFFLLAPYPDWERAEMCEHEECRGHNHDQYVSSFCEEEEKRNCVCLSMCVCVAMSVYMCMFTCEYVHLCACICIVVSVHVYMSMPMCVHMCDVSIHVCMCGCTQVSGWATVEKKGRTLGLCSAVSCSACFCMVREQQQL